MQNKQNLGSFKIWAQERAHLTKYLEFLNGIGAHATELRAKLTEDRVHFTKCLHYLTGFVGLFVRLKGEIDSRYGMATIRRLLNYRSLLQNIVYFIGHVCKRDL